MPKTLDFDFLRKVNYILLREFRLEALKSVPAPKSDGIRILISTLFLSVINSVCYKTEIEILGYGSGPHQKSDETFEISEP